MEASGILPVVKPEGITSHDVVDRLRRLYGQKRVGHAGTLDPAASGVLVTGIGKATRVLRYFHLLDKRYNAVIAFGAGTTTMDAEGEVVETAPVDFDYSALKSAISGFEGEYLQTPPMVSAIKVGGEPLYKKARRKESIERKPRRQRIYEIELSRPLHKGPDGLLHAEIMVCCDSGTYIRVLAADIAKALGTVGHLKSLVRTAVGPFSLKGCHTLDELASMSKSERNSKCIWDKRALPHIPAIELDKHDVEAVSHGRALKLTPSLANRIAIRLKEVLSEVPNLEAALVDAGLVSESRKRPRQDVASSFRLGVGGPSTSFPMESSASSYSIPTSSNRSSAERIDLDVAVVLNEGKIYTGPVALYDPEGSLVAIARPQGGILAFECVLS